MGRTEQQCPDAEPLSKRKDNPKDVTTNVATKVFMRCRWSLPRHALARSGCVLALLLLTSCTSKENRAALEPSEALGTVLAEETVRAAGPGKQVVVIVPQWGAASTVAECLKKALKSRRVTKVQLLTVDVGDPMRRSPIGLQSPDFFAALEKANSAGAMVSLAGPPLLKPGEAARLSPGHPPVLVVATASLGNVIGVPGERLQLAGLLEGKVVQLAIVDGAPEGVPPPVAVDKAHRLFWQYYRILRSP